MTRELRWALAALIVLTVWPFASSGQGSGDAVFVTIPSLDTNDQLGGRYASANFLLQGIVPVRSGLSFPTAIACAPNTGPQRTFYIAEFFFAGMDNPTEPMPETRIVAFTSDGQRGDVVTTIPGAFVVSMTLSDSNQLFMGTGVFPGRTEFAGIYRADVTRSNGAATQIVAPTDLQALLDLLETTSNPTPPEVRQLAIVPAFPEDRPFIGELLFTAGAGTLQNWDLYRVGVNGGAPQKVSIGSPWHAVASEPGGTIFVADFLNNTIATVAQELNQTSEFAELVDPFQLAAASPDRVYAVTQAFDFAAAPANGGLKAAALFQIEPFNRVLVAANGAWGLTICRQ